MRHTWTRRGWIAGSVALFAACVAAAPAGAQSTAVARGKERYTALCASCHGPDGAGDGPAAASLRTSPPDLRRIAERNGGTFQPNAVAAIIDGRTMPGGHGSEELPIWGWKGLRARKADKGPTQAMREVLAYLESIQVKPEAKPQP